MSEINVYTEQEFEKYKGICCGLKKVTDEKLARTLNKNLCYWCEERTAKFPTTKAIKDFNIIPKRAVLCEDCFIKPIEDKLKIVEKFGSVNISFISEQQKEKNKLKAKKLLEDINKNKILFCNKYEVLILKIVKAGGDFCKFFEDN